MHYDDLAAEDVAEGEAVEDLREELEHAHVVLVLHLEAVGSEWYV